MTRITAVIPALISTFLLMETSLSAADNSAKIVSAVEKTLKSLETISCGFERVTFRKSDSKTFTIAGTLKMKKPYKLRVEYPAQTIVVDGVTVWAYIPRHKQVHITAFIEGDESFPTPQSIFEKNSRGRKIETAGTETVSGAVCDVLIIISSPDERTIKVWVNRKRSFPVKTLEESPSGDTVQSTLTNVVLNEKIDDAVFSFTPPEGAEIVDMRE